MYAVVARVQVDDPDQARKVLQTARVPVVRQAPGLVAAYWLEPLDGVGMSVIVFDSKQSAEEALAYPLDAMPGVTPISVEMREVFANVLP